MIQYRVTASTLNVRQGPGKEHAVLTKLPQGLLVRGTTKHDEGKWRHIAFTTIDGEHSGWVSKEFLETAADAHSDDAAPWMPFAVAQIGIQEFPGPASNPRIVEYQKTTGAGKDDEIPWCSSFVNWCVSQAGLHGTRSAAARSWLSWGTSLDKPRPGCVVVLSRGKNPQKGHVGFYVRSSGAFVELLGGNQSNSVKIQSYPKSRVLAFRWHS